MTTLRRVFYGISLMGFTLAMFMGLFVFLHPGRVQAVEQENIPGGETAVITPTETITVTFLSSYTSPGGETATEIVAYDPMSQTMYVVNVVSATLDVIDISQPVTPTLLFQIDVTPYGSQANSVAFHGDHAAAAVQAGVAQDPGQVVFF